MEDVHPEKEEGPPAAALRKMSDILQDVPLEKAYRLLNLGATALIAAAHDGKEDVMPATWNCPLDLSPCKATVVIDKTHYTRPLMEQSGFFAVSVPTVSIVQQVMKLGTVSKNDDPLKLEHSGAEFFKLPGFDIPLTAGCVAHLIFKILPEPHVQQTYDLFIGECVKAVADSRIFRNGHYYYDDQTRDLRTLHYVAGGHFYALGDELMLDEYGLD